MIQSPPTLRDPEISLDPKAQVEQLFNGLDGTANRHRREVHTNITTDEIKQVRLRLAHKLNN